MTEVVEAVNNLMSKNGFATAKAVPGADYALMIGPFNKDGGKHPVYIAFSQGEALDANTVSSRVGVALTSWRNCNVHL